MTCTTGFAADASSSPDDAAQQAERRIDRYLDSDSKESGSSAYLAGLEVQGLPAVNLILSAALLRWQQGPPELASRRRIHRALGLAQRMAAAEGPQDRYLVREIKGKADALLVKFTQSNDGHDALISIYDSLKIWTPENLWYFLKFTKNVPRLVKNAFRLRQLIPDLNLEQRHTLAENLRRTAPSSLVQLGLLLDLGPLNESELVVFFFLAADQFEKRQNSPPDEIDHLLAPMLETIIEALQAHDEDVVSALNKAREFWERLKSHHEEHMRFFDALAHEHQTGPHVDTWIVKRLRKRDLDYTIKNNVILVNFKIDQACEDVLKK